VFSYLSIYNCLTRFNSQLPWPVSVSGFLTHVSLNWFKSIQNKYADDEEDLMEKKNSHEVKRIAKIAASKQSSWFSSSIEGNSKEEEEEMIIINLMGKRLDGNRREMAMLFFSMHGALSFFKDTRSK
jgi:hypothetical protein